MTSDTLSRLTSNYMTGSASRWRVTVQDKRLAEPEPVELGGATILNSQAVAKSWGKLSPNSKPTANLS
jgi:hypothetical protein